MPTWSRRCGGLATTLPGDAPPPAEASAAAFEPVVYAAMLPHSVWLIPEIGRGRERPAVRTIAAARQVGRELAQRSFDTILVLTPHGPVAVDGRPAVYTSPRLAMGFAEQGDGELQVVRDTDSEFAQALVATGDFTGIAEPTIDRGVAVPLYFAGRGLGAARLLALAVPRVAPGGDYAALAATGRAVRALAAQLGRRLCVLTSGELSHTIFPGAPGGYDLRAEAFDLGMQEAVAAGALDPLFSIDPALTAAVDEHALASLAVTHGLLNGLPLLRHGPDTSGSYEAPFGVGYLIATLYAGRPLPRPLP